MVNSLEAQLEKVNEKEVEILGKISERNKRKRIACESCDKSHPIQSLTLIQTHWYTPPHGCTGGAYWNEGEMKFICPETRVINRLLFDNYDVPGIERNKYGNDPEAQFKRKYRQLFKEVLESYEGSDGSIRYKNKGGEHIESREVTNGKWVNNSDVDQNRRKFGLVEKRKK